ncbi:MAG: helix-turn-helix transcriptional regulator [Cytophagales bacterium]|jgi:y4mF family transcriptional regulator|nr:helix-turn-helix transcriptional regulator [Cytophagales bacterium]
MERLADFVKSKRQALKMTQQELALKAGVGYRFVRELEAGKTTLQLEKVNDVLKLFGHEVGPVPIERSSLLK